MRPIEEQIAALDFRDDNQVVNFYEENQLYLDNYQHVTDKFKIEQLVDIKLAYADCLWNRKHLDKAINVLNQTDELNERLDSEFKFRQEADEYSRYLRGKIYSKQKNFRMSYPIFDRLSKEDPENYDYKLWFVDAKVGRLNWLFNIAYFVGLTFVFGEVFLSVNDKVSIDPLPFGVAIMGIALFCQVGLPYYFEKKKEKLPTTKPKAN